MAKYQQYEEYKESGIEWVKEIPKSWNSVSLRWISTIYSGGTPSKANLSYWEDGTIPWLNSGAVNQGLIVDPSTYITNDALQNSSAKWIPKGSLVLALAGQGKTKGMVAQTGIDTTCNQSMAAIVFNKKRFARFIFWWLTSNYQNIRNMAGGDLRDGLNLEHLGSIQCPQPSIDEAIKVTSFLDHETAQIDTLIEKQQNLIRLLKEKRQAVISHAVTKGLNPDAPLKDSGVEWLGDVPEHWELPKLIHQTSKIGDGLHSTPQYQDGTGYYFVNGNNLANGQIVVGTTSKEVPEDEYKKHYIFLDKSSVLLSINGTIGNVARYNNEMVILGKSAAYMNCADSLLPEYLMLYLKSSQAHYYFDLEVTGTTIFNLSLNSIRQMRVCVPPKQEQSKIHDFCKLQQNKYDELIEKASATIQLMQERRTALISAAVTGKIDVRGWVAPDGEVV